MAPHRHVGDVHAGAVNRDEAIDLILERVVEQLLHAAQIAEPFLADVRDERDRAGRLHLRVLHLTHDRHEHREPAAVVADAGSVEDAALALHLHVRPLGEHRVDVRGDDDVRPRRGAGMMAEHVAGPVDRHVLQPQLLEHALQLPAARFFLE